MNSEGKERVAVCPGSYDPVTNGHLDVITRASLMFDELIVGVVDASVRKSKYVFAAEERVGPVLTEEERGQDIDTVAGLVFTLAGRVPAREFASFDGWA